MLVFSIFGHVQRPAIGATAGLGCRRLTSQQQSRDRLVHLTQPVAYAPACGGERCSGAPAYADKMALTAALAIAGCSTLGLAQCKVTHATDCGPGRSRCCLVASPVCDWTRNEAGGYLYTPLSPT